MLISGKWLASEVRIVAQWVLVFFNQFIFNLVFVTGVSFCSGKRNLLNPKFFPYWLPVNAVINKVTDVIDKVLYAIQSLKTIFLMQVGLISTVQVDHIFVLRWQNLQGPSIQKKFFPKSNTASILTHTLNM